jgi:DNA-binding NarL/FixJ family response regulator
MKVLVVTEIRLYRDGVAESLRRLPFVESAISASAGPDAVMSARQGECDVVLLDMALASGTPTIRALLAARPNLKIVALGVDDDSPEVVTCAEAGISGYVSRDGTLADVEHALRGTVRGEAACSGKVAASLLRHIAMQARARGRVDRPTSLTPREREILQLLENGMTNKEIARALDLQMGTVKNHVHNVLAKYGASARTQVTSAARPRLAAATPEDRLS